MVPFRVLSRTNLAEVARSTSSISFPSFRLRTLDFSLRSFSDSCPLFSITCGLFSQNTRGCGYLKKLPFRISNIRTLSPRLVATGSVSDQTFRHSDIPTFGRSNVPTFLRARVKLERRPVERLAEDRIGMQQGELGGAQRRGRIPALAQFSVELIHQLRRRGVVDFPQRGDDVMGSGTQERPGEPDQAFSGVGARAGAVAGRDGHEVRRERMLDDVARVELERIAVRTQNHRGIQRMRAAGAPVRNKMQIRKALRPPLQESGRRGLRSRKHFPARIAEIASDTIHFRRRLPQYG